jgi:hypothetical protein
LPLITLKRQTPHGLDHRICFLAKRIAMLRLKVAKRFAKRPPREKIVQSLASSGESFVYFKYQRVQSRASPCKDLAISSSI